MSAMPQPAPDEALPETVLDALGERVQIDIYLDADTRRQQLAEDVRTGLSSRPKSLLPKYFYDATGAALFGKITDLPEYYLTRAERDIMAKVARDLMGTLKPDEIVELGPGSPTKANWLLQAADPARAVQRYIALDVDPIGLTACAAELCPAHESLRVHGIVGDIQRDLIHTPQPEGRRLVAFFGSTIGNFHPEERLALLRQVRTLLGPEGRFLLGLDLVKDTRTLEHAYNDSAGVTAAFNRNILRVLNNALDGDFEPLAYRHYAFFNSRESRIEMHLIPNTHQEALLRRLPLSVRIAPGEGIWTESSYKFTAQAVHAMAADSGMAVDAWFTDGAFALALLKPIDQRPASA